MHASPKPEVVRELTPAYVNELEGFDGIMFGISVRYGGIPAKMKTIMDATRGLWQNGKLVGKTAGVFQSTGTMQGGQESVAMNCMSFFAHQGMVFIPLGYIDPKVFSYEEIHGEAEPMPVRMVQGSLPPWNCPLPRIMEDTLPN